MDLLKEIKDRIKSNASSDDARGLESVLAHIEIAERYHLRGKKERDEHLYTDVIYRTNHAFEGILKEAYIKLAEKSANNLSPYQIEEYLLSSNALRGRVVDLLTNYRQNWRNPSTHDYQLFFSEQESFLAIVTVSAFVSILLDQILEKLAYAKKLKDLEHAAVLARDRIKDFEKLAPIDKAYKILQSYANHYIKNFSTMSLYNKSTANAQMAAFVKTVAPDLTVEVEPQAGSSNECQFDLVLKDGDISVAVETREPEPREYYEFEIEDSAAISQLSRRLYSTGLRNGILFFYPGRSDEAAVTLVSNSSWPKDLKLRVIYSTDPDEFRDEEFEEPVTLVDE